MVARITHGVHQRGTTHTQESLTFLTIPYPSADILLHLTTASHLTDILQDHHQPRYTDLTSITDPTWMNLILHHITSRVIIHGPSLTVLITTKDTDLTLRSLTMRKVTTHLHRQTLRKVTTDLLPHTLMGLIMARDTMGPHPLISTAPLTTVMITDHRLRHLSSNKNTWARQETGPMDTHRHSMDLMAQDETASEKPFRSSSSQQSVSSSPS
jgi:hypothetical protein